MRKRNATSLVELLVVMSACTIILTLSAGLVHRAMHAQSATRAFFDAERSAMRLSEQFRADVHQATAATIEDGAHDKGAFLRLALADKQSVEYRQTGDNVVRVVSQHDTNISRAEFAFPSPLELSINEELAPHRLVLSVSAGSLAKLDPGSGQQPPSAYSMPLNVQIEACLNRTNPFQQLPTAEKEPQ
ncbi:MAG TPA: hypothetical protein VGM76_05405 [Lacipirellulaceae bacterium]|jgi:hypothetical protein